MSEAYHETPRNVVDITGDGEHVSRAVHIARQNIQGMNARDLLVGLTRVYGVQSEVFVLHQLCYWFGRPKMQNRWALWKTYQEWRDESGLNRKQVDKARRGLKADGVVVETKGQHQRIFYRVDWVKLWEMLNTGERWPEDDVSNDDADPPFDESLSDPLKGNKKSLTPLGVADISDPPRGYKESLTPLRGTDSYKRLRQRLRQ
jgi:hypothetical protein